MQKDESVIPKGPYCYTPIGYENGVYKVKHCPYHRLIEDRPNQYDGWCDFLEKGDLELEKEMVLTDQDTGEKIRGDELPFPVSLLWDSCKECGINDDDDDTEVQD
jgi:hypothetical protein